MSKKNSFVLYNDDFEIIQDLTLEERGQLLSAIFEYMRNGTIPKFKGGLNICFKFIKQKLDRDSEKYEDVCQKRSEAGKKGSKNRWNNDSKCYNEDNKNSKAIQTITKITDSDSVSECECESEGGSCCSDSDASVNATETTTNNNENDDFISHGLAKVTKAEYAELSEEFGEDNVRLYMQKCDAYLKRKNIAPYDSIALTISAWMKKDNIHKPVQLQENADNREHSYDLDAIISQSMAYITEKNK